MFLPSLLQIRLSLITCAFLLFYGTLLNAAEELMVDKDLEVYTEPNTSSDVLTILEAGEVVPISSQKAGKFRKVIIQTEGKKRIGYVLSNQAGKSQNHEAKKTSEKDIYHHRFGIGVPVAMNYSMQSGWKFVSSDGSQTEIGPMSGAAFSIGASVDFPIEPTWSLRGEVNFRKSHMTGTAKPLSSSGTSTEVERSMSFLSFGGSVKFYLNANGNFWFGGGAEIAKANEVDLTFGGRDKAIIAESDYPTHFIVKIETGYDYKIYQDFYLIPEIRGLGIFNTNPSTYGAELALTSAYAF